MPAQQGVDSLGRRFRVINGKRVKAGDDASEYDAKPKKHLVTIEDLVTQYTKNARGAPDMKDAIARLINKRLRTTFNVAAKNQRRLTRATLCCEADP